ncbi:MAG: ABC transporter ATP-binding protein [Alkalinema sp. RU_4_3]|nr:ABC transporter ATP-binding protein [Alkalinema sp. RU_4_3]
MNSSNLVLDVQEIYGGYIKDLDILQGASMKVHAGELVTIVGPNGAGKSTLAKAIFGLVTPHTGQILFNGQNIVGLKPDRIVQLGMGYVPQIANVFRSLTIDENLDMGAFIGLEQNLRARKGEMYDRFPALVPKRNQSAGTLSGGERQQLAMAKALMLNPTLLVLDEPSAALSPIMVTNVFEQIQQIRAEGTAIILVEQNARQALKMSDRGYVLESGRDRFEGRGEDLLNDPKVGELYLGVTSH